MAEGGRAPGAEVTGTTGARSDAALGLLTTPRSTRLRIPQQAGRGGAREEHLGEESEVGFQEPE